MKTNPFENTSYAVKPMWELHRNLCRAQATPLVGIIISPIEGMLGLVQAIVALPAVIFLVTVGYLCSKSLLPAALAAGAHLGMGLLAICYSIGNICTLTLLGYKIESDIAAKTPPKSLFA